MSPIPSAADLLRQCVTAPNYAERVYAGVLGKIIGVYLGRPFENWSHERIMAELGEVDYYVHQRLGVPLIVTDDDISGTFTFLRALPDHGNSLAITAQQIGETWLNYLIENRTVLWWGGLGRSTEHTAYLRLKHGIPAPHSGSIETNGRVVAEQIGSQIFIDGWGMIAPGDPQLAADLARRAASVSHDGEAIYGAQVVAAMEALAFVESDIGKLLDAGQSVIPRDSTIHRLIDDLREWRADEPDWRVARQKIAANYGYDKFGGGCHMVPNHALIIHALLYGDGDFQKSLMIVNTCGWDTDCNSGNLGCLLGIRGGLPAIDNGPDWRGPVADRIYLPSADCGRAITDAATEAIHIVNIARALHGAEPIAPKSGARFHFEFPGSVQGFHAISGDSSVNIENVEGHSRTGARSLAIHFRPGGESARIATPTHVPPEALGLDFYSVIAAPTLYPGQVVQAVVSADAANVAPVTVRLLLRHYGKGHNLETVHGDAALLEPSATEQLQWIVPKTNGRPIAQIGLEVVADSPDAGTLYLDSLTWNGTPQTTFQHPSDGTPDGWGSAVDTIGARDGGFEIIRNEGRGLLICGTREWTDYRFSATLTPKLAEAVGIAARVQGMRRYYALLIDHCGKARLVKFLGDETVLAESNIAWRLGASYELALDVRGDRLRAFINGELRFDAMDSAPPLDGGGIALMVETGYTLATEVTIGPACE